MEIDPNDRNPLYQNALRLCDINPGVKFIKVDLINTDNNIFGEFCSKPYEQKISENNIALIIDFTFTETSSEDLVNKYEMYLSDAGVIKYKDGHWHKNHFLIHDDSSEIKYLNDWIDSEEVKSYIKQLKDQTDRYVNESEDEEDDCIEDSFWFDELSEAES